MNLFGSRKRQLVILLALVLGVAGFSQFVIQPESVSDVGTIDNSITGNMSVADSIGGAGGVSMSDVVENGDSVKTHYKGTLDDGSVFDSSEGRDPLEFTVGAGQMIAGFDDGVLGMAVGETKNIHIAAADAYGEPNTELIVEVPKDQFGDTNGLVAGGQIFGSGPNGPIAGTIVSVGDENITVDFNHRLAGQALNFEIELVELKKA